MKPLICSQKLEHTYAIDLIANTEYTFREKDNQAMKIFSNSPNDNGWELKINALYNEYEVTISTFFLKRKIPFILP